LETDQDFIKRATESRADAILTINQTESVTYVNSNSFSFGGRQASGGSFDIKIFVPNNPRPVWRGLMKTTSSGYGNIGATSKTSAETIIERLIQDGML
jgi:hypothetical protein